jgi:UDP-N-acetylglucosamine transferase subunit ALG13
MEVSPEYARNDYRTKIDNHLKTLADQSAAAGLEYVFMDTSKPLDEGLRNYLAVRQRRR